MRLTVLVAALLVACGDSGDSSDGEDDGSDAAADAPDGPAPPEDMLPEPSGSCPGFADGAGCTADGASLYCTFAPTGIVPRKVRIWMSDAARDRDGALVVFWHGLTRNSGDAALAHAGLGPDVIQEIIDEGGIVASPERSEKREMTSFTELPWLIALTPGDDDDLLVMDEVVACAREEVGIDTRRIHTTGMSAGGLHTGVLGPRRSGYLASTATLSGGQLYDPEVQDPSNLHPVAVFHGGPMDMVVLKFQDFALSYREKLQAQGHFSMICNHGKNHTAPPEATAAAWRFFQDHPYGTVPSPYAEGLPETIPSFCEL